MHEEIGENEFCWVYNTNNLMIILSSVRLLSTYHFIQTLLHILQMGISYLLMLIAMTFNVYLFLAVILGAGLGHLLFGWRRTTILDRNEHCHWKYFSSFFDIVRIFSMLWNIFFFLFLIKITSSFFLSPTVLHLVLLVVRFFLLSYSTIYFNHTITKGTYVLGICFDAL